MMVEALNRSVILNFHQNRLTYFVKLLNCVTFDTRASLFFVLHRNQRQNLVSISASNFVLFQSPVDGVKGVGKEFFVLCHDANFR